MTQDTLRAATTRPLRRDAERNRQRILAAAEDVFRERGLEATLDDIAHHAGVGVGTVYRRFPNKEHLIEAMFAAHLDEIGEIARKALEHPDAWTGLVTFFQAAAEQMAANRGLHDILFSASFGKEQVAQARDRLIQPCTELIERAQRAGQLRADFRPTDLPILLKMVSAAADYAHRVEPELWRRYLVLLLDGCRANAGAPSPLPVPALDEETMQKVMDTQEHPRHRV